MFKGMRYRFACLFLLFCLLGFNLSADPGTPGGESETGPYPLDFKKLSDEEVLLQLNALTPSGTGPRQVAQAIVNVLWEGDQKHKLHYYDRPYYLDRESHGEAHISAHIGDYKKGWRAYKVFIIWTFHQNQTLDKILIRRQEVKTSPQFGG